MSTAPTLDLERAVLAEHSCVIALDEVGRGALAGPVAVGASIVDAAVVRTPFPEGLRDSKLITEKRRPAMAEAATAWVAASAVGWADAGEVDEVGIITALGLAASRAIAQVSAGRADAASALVLLDGNHDYVSAVHPEQLRVRAVVKGDRDCASISAASVIAKVARDALMARLHTEHVAYGWDRNKGYASAAHRAAIEAFGLSPHHRASWAIGPAPALF